MLVSADLVSSLIMVLVDVVLLVVLRGKVARFLAVVSLIIIVLHTLALLVS